MIVPVLLDRLGQLAEGEFVGVRPQEVTQLWRYRSKLKPGQVVIRQPVTYATKTDFSLHRLLRCIAHNCLLSKLAEYEVIHEEEYFIDPEQLETAFTDWPQAVENTNRLLATCSFDFDFTTPKNKKLYTPSRIDDTALLR